MTQPQIAYHNATYQGYPHLQIKPDGKKSKPFGPLSEKQKLEQQLQYKNELEKQQDLWKDFIKSSVSGYNVPEGEEESFYKKYIQKVDEE